MSRTLYLLIVLVVGTHTACAALSETMLGMAVRSERGAAGLEQKSVSAADHEIVYLEGGQGETIVLLHGFSADKDNWTRFAKYLTDRYHVVIPDIPGFGESTRDPEAVYDIASQARRIRAFAEAIGLERFHLAGNSMGGNLSGAYAAMFTDQVLSMGLLAPSGVRFPELTPLQEGIARGENMLLVESVADFERILGLNFVKQPFIPRPVKRYFAERAAENRTFNEKINGDLRAHPFYLEPHFERMTIPALVLWGDTDRVLHPSGARVFYEGLPNARLVIMEACGHIPMLERPTETAEHYLAFLASIGRD
jgi:abhydrolase domain-containing protein 6